MMRERDELVKIISSANEWEELNHKLLATGFVNEIYTDRNKFRSLIQTVWSNNNIHTEKEINPLPGREVASNGKTYFIHGLVHDNPLVSINPCFKQYITKQLENHEIICEDGFISWFNNAHSFNEAQHFGFNKLKFSDFFTSLCDSIIHKLSGEKEDELTQKVRGLRNIGELLEVRASLFKNYLPEPLGMNSYLYVQGKGTIHGNKGRLPLRLERYFYEAKEAISYSEKNNLEQLHIVIGCAHELPLEYLLQNRSLLERYK